jgi:predicted extracellular nuclease
MAITQGRAQTNRYQIRTVAFYNLENLFDTENDSLTYDDDRTPDGRDRWTTRRYRDKIEKLSRSISGIGKELTGTPPDLIGLCEAENRQVLADLIQHPNLLDGNYGLIHFDSPDERGIDVALLYKKNCFSPVAFSSHRLLVFNEDDERDYTRDPLVVSGLLDGEMIHLIVNHWPSRSGGQERSDPYRKAAAALNSTILDSLGKVSRDPKIIIMGDFNDNPTDDSLKKILNAKGDTSALEKGMLYNPMENMYKKGAGSLAYRDAWNLFDQVLLNAFLVKDSAGYYRFWKAGIYNPGFLRSKSGRFRGYPARTYSGGRYTNGYSDHYPVYIYLIREAP